MSKQKPDQVKYQVGQLVLAREGKEYVLGMIKNVRSDGYDIQWADDFEDSASTDEPYRQDDVERFMEQLQLFLTDRDACDKIEL